jgi:hypothetical protein
MDIQCRSDSMFSEHVEKRSPNNADHLQIERGVYRPQLAAVDYIVGREFRSSLVHRGSSTTRGS